MTQPGGEQKTRRIGAPLAGLGIGLGLLILSVCLFVYATVFGPGPKAANPAGTEVTFVHGQGVGAFARELQHHGVIRSALMFRVFEHMHGRGNRLHAGTYLFPSQASMLQVLGQIEAGKVEQTFVTIPEGLTSAQAVRILMAVPGLTGDVDVPPEGSLLPETYLYQRGETREAVLERMLKAGRDTLDTLWAHRAKGLPFNTKEDALILASVVEKETGLASERPRVAAVFVNRLRTGMRLESDPTVIYGVSHGDPLGRGLTRTELDTDTPWNTYTEPKLPVTPICNPGRASLQAVLNPAPTKDIYFVADGTGGHAFSATYEEHLVNVAKWRQIEANQLAAMAAHAAGGNPSASSSASGASSSVVANTGPGPH
ncbi:MAG: endolytic transglycosylase MltG, partial [Asticcacaulis sp.]